MHARHVPGPLGGLNQLVVAKPGQREAEQHPSCGRPPACGQFSCPAESAGAGMLFGADRGSAVRSPDCAGLPGSLLAPLSGHWTILPWASVTTIPSSPKL